MFIAIITLVSFISSIVNQSAASVKHNKMLSSRRSAQSFKPLFLTAREQLTSTVYTFGASSVTQSASLTMLIDSPRYPVSMLGARHYTNKGSKVSKVDNYLKRIEKLQASGFPELPKISPEPLELALGNQPLAELLKTDSSLLPLNLQGSAACFTADEWLNRLVLFEDRDILVAYKPPTVLSQPEKGGKVMDLSEALFRPTEDEAIMLEKTSYVNNKFKNTNAADSDVGDDNEAGNDDFCVDQSKRLYVVHRLDRPCSGVMVFAKNPTAAANLGTSFQNRQVDKGYICVVNGALVADGKPVRLEHLVLKTNADKTKVFETQTPSSSKDESAAVKKRKVKNSLRGGELVPAKLTYESLISFGAPTRRPAASNGTETVAATATGATGAAAESSAASDEEAKKLLGPAFFQSLLKVHLDTGRKHQIRAQMAHIGNAICGDVKYGARQSFRTRDITLHSYFLRFPHPSTGKMLNFAAEAPAVWEKRFGEPVMAKIREIVDLKMYKGKRPPAPAATDSAQSEFDAVADMIGAGRNSEGEASSSSTSSSSRTRRPRDSSSSPSSSGATIRAPGDHTKFRIRDRSEEGAKRGEGGGGREGGRSSSSSSSSSSYGSRRSGGAAGASSRGRAGAGSRR